MKKWVIVTPDNQYVSASDVSTYTDNIDDAFVYYLRKDAMLDRTERGERVVEVFTKNTLVKPVLQADVIEKLLKKAKKKV